MSEVKSGDYWTSEKVLDGCNHDVLCRHGNGKWGAIHLPSLQGPKWVLVSYHHGLGHLTGEAPLFYNLEGLQNYVEFIHQLVDAADGPPAPRIGGIEADGQGTVATVSGGRSDRRSADQGEPS